jgi:hypothetical protein
MGGGGVRPGVRPSGGVRGRGGGGRGVGARATDASGQRHVALAEELGAWLTGGAAHSEGWRRLLIGWPGQHSTGGVVQTVLTGSNLNSSIGFKFLQILTESKFTFPYSKNLK